VFSVSTFGLIVCESVVKINFSQLNHRAIEIRRQNQVVLDELEVNRPVRTGREVRGRHADLVHVHPTVVSELAERRNGCRVQCDTFGPTLGLIIGAQEPRAMLRLAAGFTQVRTLAFSPDNRHLLAVGMRPRLGGFLSFSRVVLWNLSDPTATVRSAIDEGFDPIAGYFLPDGRILGVDNRGHWRACEVGGGRYRQVESAGRSGRSEPAGISPDGNWVAVIGRGGVEVLPLPGNPRSEWWLELDDGQEAVGVAFSPKSEVVAVVTRGWWGRDHVAWIAIHETDTWRCVRDAGSGSLDRGEGVPVELFATAWAPDGLSIARIGRGGFDVFDVYTWTQTASRTVTGSQITAAIFDPSGRTFATATKDGLVHLWDTGEWPSTDTARRATGTGGLVHLRDTGEWPGHSLPEDMNRPPSRSLDWGVGRIQAMAFSQDGTLGAVAGAQGDVVVWDALE
jgi:WD40 repeat protein